MRRLVLAAGLAGLLTVATAGVTFGNHDHNLMTPGTTVVDIANGNTENCTDEPAGHNFHENVHLGTPGAFAFGQGGQVQVVKTEDATC